MAARKETKQTQRQPNSRPTRFTKIGKSSSQIVIDAANLLDEEMASGIVAAKQMQQRFRKERRINPGDFKDALNKFQGDAHEMVNMLNDQFGELQSEETSKLVNRLNRNTHDLLDLVVELVNTSAEVTDLLLQPALEKTKPGK